MALYCIELDLYPRQLYHIFPHFGWFRSAVLCVHKQQHFMLWNMHQKQIE